MNQEQHKQVSYWEDFRRQETVQTLTREIAKALGDRAVTFMEVCGGHTGAILRFGLRQLLPPNLSLVSGPGCPVCVTPESLVELALNMLRERPEITVATFGDLVRVPSREESLESLRAQGGDVRTVYSALDALQLAKHEPSKLVVLFGIGFETTAPGSAATLLHARAEGVDNLLLLSGHKLMPPAMEALAAMGEMRLDGFICPGHVSTIIGSRPYEFLAQRYGKACAISGFEPVDLLDAILMLVRQVQAGRPRVEISYKRSVHPEGNPKAMATMWEVFEPGDSVWRGLGTIPGSGLQLRPEWAERDPVKRLGLTIPPETNSERDRGCRCGEVLRGIVPPPQCPLFGKACTPEHPVGTCMVGGEGACRAYYSFDTL